MKPKSLISINKEIMSGRACIRGTRIPAYIIYGMFKAGDSIEQIQAAYDYCTTEQIEAAIKYCESKTHGGKVAAQKNFTRKPFPKPNEKT